MMDDGRTRYWSVSGDDSSDGTEEPAETVSGRSRDSSPHEPVSHKSPPSQPQQQKKRARTTSAANGQSEYRGVVQRRLSVGWDVTVWVQLAAL